MITVFDRLFSADVIIEPSVPGPTEAPLPWALAAAFLLAAAAVAVWLVIRARKKK